MRFLGFGIIFDIFEMFAILGLVGLILSSIFDRFGLDLWVENPPKIDQESIQKSIEKKMQVGMRFGWLLGRFWVDFGPKSGAKFAPKSKKRGFQDEIKKSMKI